MQISYNSNELIAKVNIVAWTHRKQYGQGSPSLVILHTPRCTFWFFFGIFGFLLLQFLKFWRTPLLFFLLETCHYNSWYNTSMPWSTSPAKLGPLAGGVFSYRTVLPLFNWIRQSSWRPFFSLLLPHSPTRHCRRRLPALAACLFSHRHWPTFAASHCRGWVATSLGHRQWLALARRRARRCHHSWSARIALSRSCGS